MEDSLTSLKAVFSIARIRARTLDSTGKPVHAEQKYPSSPKAVPQPFRTIHAPTAAGWAANLSFGK